MKIARITTLALLASSILFADIEWRGENTNFTIAQSPTPLEDRDSYLYNYNRLRLYVEWSEDAYFITAIGDGVNYLSSRYTNSSSFELREQLHSNTPIKTQTPYHKYDAGAIYAKLYRLYGGYDDGKNRIVLGLQNITMGIGHIWTPSNLFNPINTYALEPDETFGVLALYASHYIDDQSQIYGAVSQQEDDSFKYALGYKTTLNDIDITLNTIKSDSTKMAGYTIEGDLADTGIQLRSEGAYFKTNLRKPVGTSEERELFQGIIGADYAFQEGLNLTIEALYSSQTFTYEEMLANIDAALLGNLVMSHYYLGTTMSYDFTIYLSGTLLYIESFHNQTLLDANSRFVSPSLSYTLNDNSTFTIGAMLYNGPEKSEFGMLGNSYYFKYVLSF